MYCTIIDLFYYSFKNKHNRAFKVQNLSSPLGTYENTSKFTFFSFQNCDTSQIKIPNNKTIKGAL